MTLPNRWKRWIKTFLRVDPLVGMYIVNFPVIGIILARIETKEAPRYLAHFFNATGDGKVFENHCIMHLPDGDGAAHWDLFYSREEAQRWWNWIEEAKRQGPMPGSIAWKQKYPQSADAPN